MYNNKRVIFCDTAACASRKIRTNATRASSSARYSATISSEIALDQITIAALYWESVATFNRLFDNFKALQDPPDTLPDDFGRLGVWTENAAAHRRGVMLLDHLLREALSVKEMVKGLLMELNNVLEETLGMASEEAEAKGIKHNKAKPETTKPQTVDSEMDDEIRST
ncbi:hypothetical protein FPQ18DRAFT_379732 [Pyronema domesticum]|nr:hypothetical protein FPQ18DRAFT_379732 [Pyronema domesticum]